jgi:hypothetical protein
VIRDSGISTRAVCAVGSGPEWNDMYRLFRRKRVAGGPLVIVAIETILELIEAYRRTIHGRRRVVG